MGSLQGTYTVLATSRITGFQPKYLGLTDFHAEGGTYLRQF